MEVVPVMSDSSPFQRHDVAEWSHMDRLTGMMETARVETDRWAASTSTTAHSYGKVVDSRNRSLPDGSAQQRQRQQLEVFQTKGPGGSLQVIRTQSVSSSNSSWRGSPSSRTPLPAITQDFANLQLTLNPLDLSSEKSKGSVGRSGSIGGRRPPSRPRSIVGKVVPPPLAIEEDDVSTRLAQVSRICQQVHDDAKKTAFKANERAGKNIASLRDLTSSATTRSSVEAYSNGHSVITRKKSTSIEDLHNGEDAEDVDEGLRRSSKVRRSLQFPLKKLEARGGVSKLLQDLEESNKRNASEGRIARKSFEALENVLKRGNNKFDSLNKESEDSESSLAGNEENGEVNNKHVVNNVSLDSFSKKFNIFSLDKRHSFTDASDSKDELSSNDESKSKSPATKRHSFVTVESLKEVRGRLKRLNSPLDGLDTESGMDEDHDDGIGTDESAKREVVEKVAPSRVKSYVYGMEAITTSNRPVLGTGSLESRTSNKSGMNGTRSDEWYNRRKSYGFEKVTADQNNDSSSTLSSKGEDSKLESTDSGICRSSEAFTVPSWSRKPQVSLWNKVGDSDVLSVSHSIQIRPKDDDEEASDKRKPTVVSFGGKNELMKSEVTNHKVTDVVRRSFTSANMLSASLVNGLKSDDSEEKGRNQHVTVSIPIVHEDASPTVGSRRLFYQQLAQGTTLSVEKCSKKTVDHPPPSLLASRLGDDWWLKPNRALRDYSPESKSGPEDWRVPSKLLSSAMKRHSFAGDNSWKNINGIEPCNEVALQGTTDGEESWRRAIKQSDTEMKRHSIAVDELKYVHDNSPTAHDADNSILKKHKKVEFCKTEVHFAAEPGRFNIVETDEKPPSTNMFRRRRRQINTTTEVVRGSNLPEVRFGDSIYEKQWLGGNEEVSDVKIPPVRPTTLRLCVQEDAFQDTDDHVFTQANATIRPNEEEEDDDEELNPDSKPRSILKNFSKPQPYLLGQEDDSPPPGDDDHDEKWGVRLRPVAREPAVWKSTVTVSSRDAVMPVEYSGQSELQKLLRSLRPANQRKHDMLLAARYSGTAKPAVSDWSVAERIRHVEQVATESKGFSTRVNFGGGEATVLDEEAGNQRLFQGSERPKPVWQRREESAMSSDEIAKRKPLVVQIGNNSWNHETQRKGTTTKITIDLSPSPTSVKENRYPTHDDRESRQNGVLHSPSLIMKTFPSPEKCQAKRSSLMSLQEKWKNSSELHSNSFLKGGIRSYVDNSKAWTAEYNFRTNGQTNVRRLAMGIGDRGIADGEGSPSHGSYTATQNGHHWGSTQDKCCDDEVVVTNSLPNKPPVSSSASRGSSEEVVGQLDAWRALYCDIDSELSDDSEKADEEVRSFMSTEGEGGSSEISGSWSRATAQRLCQKQEYNTGYSVSETSKIAAEPATTHSSVATHVVPNYADSSRLRAVETLVSTRSGQPKITSISLRYDGDQRQTDASRFTSRTTISPERRHSSYNEGDVKARPDNVTSTFLEPTYKSQTALFSKTESHSVASADRQDTFSGRSQVFNSKERLTFSEKLDSENRKELSAARMQPPAKLTTVTSEPQARTFTSMLSAFEKQQFNNRRSLSPPVTTSSPRVLSSFERKLSNCSSSRRSQSPDLPQQSGGLFNKRSPSPSAHHRLSFSESSETADKSMFTRRNSQELLSSSRDRNSSSVDKSRQTSTHIDSEVPRRNSQELLTSSRDRNSSSVDKSRQTSTHIDSEVPMRNSQELLTSSREKEKSRLITTHIESDVSTKATNRSPNPTMKLTTLSKNSHNKDFIGRVRSESPVHLNNDRTAITKHISSGKPASLKDITESPIRSGSQSPIYQNRDVYHSEVKSSRSRKSEVVSEVKLTECGLQAAETDSILEELTRAADQILQAVNGYTDEESRRASSDDDRARRAKERRVLGTIVEAPTRDDRRDSLKMNGNSKRPQRTASKTKLGPTSSTSSVESITRETRRTPAKTSSRTARMVQRASSRELLLQAHASSSEDIASGTESSKPRAPPPRRSRTSSSSTKTTTQTSPSKSREKKEATETSKTTRERSSVSKVKSKDATVSSHDSRRKTPETKQYPVKEKNIPAVSSSMSGRDRVTSSRSTTSRTKKSASSKHEGTNKTNK